MQIVRTIAWVLLAVMLALFAVANWKPVEVLIWENLILETKLPVLVLGAFLIGLLPMWLAHRIALWRYRRRIASAERTETPNRRVESTPPAATAAHEA